MAKEDKKASKKTSKKIGRSAQDEGFKYGVNELADELGVEPASARVTLRKLGVEKEGSVYGWKTDRDFDAAVKQCKAGSGRKKAAEDEPVKKSAKKGADKKTGAKKQPAKDEGGRGRRREEREEEGLEERQ